MKMKTMNLLTNKHYEKMMINDRSSYKKGIEGECKREEGRIAVSQYMYLH